MLAANVQALARTLQTMSDLAEPLAKAADLVAQCLNAGGKLLTCGNGGSAADASHFATEFACRYDQDRRPYPAISLVDSGSTLSATANDYGFDQIFARQVCAYGSKNDALIVFSTSGKSRNIVEALKTANQIGMKSIAFLGKGGAAAKGLATVEMLVPSGKNGGTDVTARVQEAHLVLYHTLCEMVEAKLPRS